MTAERVRERKGVLAVRRANFWRGRFVLGVACAAIVAATERIEASGVDRAGSSAESVESPLRVEIVAGNAILKGRRETSQLIASGFFADGSTRDLTRALEWTSLNPDIAEVSRKGRVVPKGNGSATIVARRGKTEARTTIRVERMELPSPVSFRRDVIPAFSQAGCNMGACHGTPTGKAGFRLSLRGYLPDQDFMVLSRENGGRRINPFDPDASLLLRKPLGEVPHEGGLRLRRDSKTFEFLHDWIAEGGKDDPNAPAAVALELLPGPRLLNGSADSQQLVAIARYADGSSRDVTPICYYDSSSNEIAEVNADGFVRFKSKGEAAIIAHYLDLVANVRLTHLVEIPGFKAVEVPTDNPIDRAVFAKWNRMRIEPSEPCTDREFVRRVYIDAIGLLPNVEEVSAFLEDPSADRRTKLVDRLLKRPEFNDYWTLKLADVLRANGRLIQTKGSIAFHRWIKTHLERETPLDEFARELLAGNGSTFKNPEANYYRISRDPQTATETTAQLFLGVRIQCAKCHNHPFERWTQDDYYGFAAFFARVRHKPGTVPGEEVVYNGGDGEVHQPRTGRLMPPKALGGPILEPTANPSASKSPEFSADDRRRRLALWLTGPENPFFARCLANRIWFHLMGRGVVEPVDDFRDSNPPSNDELLQALSDILVQSRFNLRTLVRSILSSRTYQLSSRTRERNADDSIYFSHALTKLLPAEVLLDAISSVAGKASAFRGLPGGTRATQIPDSAMEDPFLKTFGRPARELACECERESDSNLSQALQLIGGATINDKLHADDGRMAALAKSDRSPESIVRELYLVALAREPSAGELASAVKHLRSVPDRRQAVEDLGWVLINSKEFLFRH